MIYFFIINLIIVIVNGAPEVKELDYQKSAKIDLSGDRDVYFKMKVAKVNQNFNKLFFKLNYHHNNTLQYLRYYYSDDETIDESKSFDAGKMYKFSENKSSEKPEYTDYYEIKYKPKKNYLYLKCSLTKIIGNIEITSEGGISFVPVLAILCIYGCVVVGAGLTAFIYFCFIKKIVYTDIFGKPLNLEYEQTNRKESALSKNSDHALFPSNDSYSNGMDKEIIN